MNRFATYDQTVQRYTVSIPLIGQLGKNYADNNNRLITGDEVLQLALNKISVMQGIVGGRYVYVECEPKDKIIEFYERNGFVEFARRPLDKDETNIDGDVLVQMLKYM